MRSIYLNINPDKRYICDSVKLDNGFVVERYDITPSTLVAYVALEPYTSHALFCHIDGVCYGLVEARPVPDVGLPAHQCYHAFLDNLAWELAKQAYPQDFAENCLH